MYDKNDNLICHFDSTPLDVYAIRLLEFATDCSREKIIIQEI